MSTNPSVRTAVIASIAAVVLVMTGQPAFALSNAPDLTWGVKGKVYALAQYGDTVFVGGTITRAISPTGKRPEIFNVAAFSVSTGSYLPGFTATVTRTIGTAKVTALAVSNDGSKLYIGGIFDTVDGQARKNFAAVDVATGAQLDANVDPAPSGKVMTIVAGSQLVYFGGAFTRVGNQNRSHLAAISAATGALSTTWTPSATAGNDPCPSQLPKNTTCGPVSDGGTGGVHSLALSPDGSGLFVGGNFYYMNGTPRNAIAEVSATNGSLLSWLVPWQTIPSEGQGQPYSGPNVVRTIIPTSTRIYVGYGRTPNGFEAFSATTKVSSGECASGCATQVWSHGTPGNAESMALSPDGSRLFVGGHFGTAVLDYQISSCGGNVYAHGLVSVDPATGTYFCDWFPVIHPFGGQSAPGSQVDPPNYQGATSMQITPGALFVGGKITSISGLVQPGFAKFTL